MSFDLLIAAARSRRGSDRAIVEESLAWAALRRLRDAFPDTQRTPSLTEFARLIVAVEDVPGRADEARLISLVLGGRQLSDQMHRFFETLDGLTDAQQKKLDELQSQHAKALADFFSDLGVTDLFPDIAAEDKRSLTEVGGIGTKTADNLKTNGVRDLSELAALSDAQIAELEPRVPKSPGRDLTKWRAEAIALLATEEPPWTPRSKN